MLLVFLLTAVIILSGCGGKADGPNSTSTKSSEMSPEIATIYEAAKKEGKVIYWSSDDIELPALLEAFSKRYPGIKVEPFEITPQQIVEKIITENNANQANVDVFNIYWNDMPLFVQRDLAMKFEWNKVFGLEPEIIDYDNRLLKGWHLSFPLIYNKNLVKENELPKSWEDILDPKWKGKILLEFRANAFPILSYVWGEEKTVNYVKDLMKNDPILIKGGTVAIQAMASGQAALGIGTYPFKVTQLQAQGAPLGWVALDPTPLITLSYGVLKKAPNPNAGILLASWLASEEALKVREAANGGYRLEGPHMGKIANMLKEKNIKTISEAPEKEKIKSSVEKQVTNILNSIKK